MQFVKNLLPTAHLEKRKATAIQALTYCMKDITENDNQLLLEAPQGCYTIASQEPQAVPRIITTNTENRTVCAILLESKLRRPKGDERLEIIKARIDGGARDAEIAEDDFPMYIKHYRGIGMYRSLVSKPRNHAMNVIVIQGPTGTGKSKYCMDTYGPDAYWKQRSNWWDNYQNHTTVVIDEFYGWIPFDTLLRICDRYPLQLETKGGQVNFVADTIIITTNAVPERWYKNAYFKAFVRRVNTWICIPVWGETKHTQEYSQAVSWMVDNDIGPC